MPDPQTAKRFLIGLSLAIGASGLADYGFEHGWSHIAIGLPIWIAGCVNGKFFS